MSRTNLLMHCCWLCCCGIGQADDIPFRRVQLDARFRSEGAGVGDFNHDGRQDVVAGEFWYEAPDWTRHEFKPPGDFWAGVGYSLSFCNWTFDVNADGWDDIIMIGFPGRPVNWYENPRGEAGHWAEHLIWHSACNETPQFKDLTGDGRPEIVMGSQPEAQIGYLEIPAGDAAFQKWTFVPVNAPGNPGQNGSHHFYHGLGVTDINADGRLDVVIPHGWHEAPADPAGEWTFHNTPFAAAAADMPNPVHCADIYSEDLDLDGDPDVMMSSAHAFGVWWFENRAAQGEGEGEGEGEAGFRQHLIDDSFSQTHALCFEDLDGDGQRELITGKRYFAHNGHDPGALDPVCMHYFTISKSADGPRFEKHEILAGRDTGIGTQFTVADIDGDGRLDIALANKKGVNLLLQLPRE